MFCVGSTDTTYFRIKNLVCGLNVHYLSLLFDLSVLEWVMLKEIVIQ